MSDLPERIRSYIPQGDGYNSEFADDLTEAADELQRLRRVEQAARKLVSDFKNNAVLHAIVWKLEAALEDK